MRQCGDFRIEIKGDAVTITGYEGSATNVTIPERFGGLPVTAIGEWAFGGMPVNQRYHT
jgi:hypothetical protein